MSTVAASSTPLFVRLNTTCTTDPATGVEGCYSAVVRDPRGPPRAPRVTEPPPVILDVDTGIDDSLALLYACASPEVELVAATCVAGNVDARQVAVNTRAVLELADRADVEVALGRETPLVRPLTTTPETHGPRGIGYAELPPPSRPLSRRHAVDLLVDEARRRPGALTLGARARRHREGEADARTSARPGRPRRRRRARAPHAHRPLPRRCAALLYGVPQPLRRLLRRLHPRSAGVGRGPRPEPGPRRGAGGGRGAGRHPHHRRDGHRLAPRLGQAAQPRHRRGGGRRGVPGALRRACGRPRRAAGVGAHPVATEPRNVAP